MACAKRRADANSKGQILTGAQACVNVENDGKAATRIPGKYRQLLQLSILEQIEIILGQRLAIGAP